MDDPLALAAVEGVKSGMVVGLGTGRAASRGIEALARRVAAERLRVRCVATSVASFEQAAALGLRVEAFEDVAEVDLLFDGADEVDGRLRMIKGRGGAMTREKIVACAALRRVYLVQKSKMVSRLGETARLPVEVMPCGLASVKTALGRIGLVGEVRAGPRGERFVTDNGCVVIDAALPAGVHLDSLRAALDATAGVVGHGLFLDEADEVLVEDGSGRVERLAR